MSLENTIQTAGQKLKTLLIIYTEKDGSNEGWREVEPYSFRQRNGHTYLFAHDIRKGDIRQFDLSRINQIEISESTYIPRWPVEF